MYAMMMVACLVISNPEPSTDIFEPEIQEGIAPQLPPWPDALPRAKEDKGGVYLPKPLDAAVMHRLMFLDVYPELCQASLDLMAESKLLDLQCEGAATEAASKICSEKTDTWQWWHWPAILGGAVLGGFAAGYVLRGN